MSDPFAALREEADQLQLAPEQEQCNHYGSRLVAPGRYECPWCGLKSTAKPSIQVVTR